MSEPEQGKSVYVILPTSSNLDDYNGDIDYCGLELRAAYLRQLLAEMDEVVKRNDGQKHGPLLSMRYWDYADWFEYCEETDEDDTWTEPRDEPLVLTAKPEWVEAHEQRVEMEIRTVYGDRVHWEAMPKHTNVTVESHPLERAQIEDILKKLEANDGGQRA